MAQVSPVSSAAPATALAPSIVFFLSARSGACRRVEGFIAQVLQRRRNQRTFLLRRVDVDERPDLAERFSVTDVPTLLVVENRRIRGRLDRPRTVAEIRLLLAPWLR